LIDVDIFVDHANSQDDLDKLQEVADKGENEVTNYDEVKEFIDGYARFIRFEAYQKDGEGKLDVSNPDQNLILEIFEGRMQDGFISKDPPVFGRWFKDGNHCYMGYFTRDDAQNKWGPQFRGKGIFFKDQQEAHSGIYDTSIDLPKTEK